MGGRRWILSHNNLPNLHSRHDYRRVEAWWRWPRWPYPSNQPPMPKPIHELMKESGSSPWTELYTVDSSLEHVSNVEFHPSITLNINPSLLSKQEEKLCNVMRLCYTLIPIGVIFHDWLDELCNMFIPFLIAKVFHIFQKIKKFKKCKEGIP